MRKKNMKRIFTVLAAVAVVGAAALTVMLIAGKDNAPHKVESAVTESKASPAVASETTRQPEYPPQDPEAPNRPGHYYQVVAKLADTSNDPKLVEAKHLLAKVGYETEIKKISPAACGDKKMYEQLKLDKREYYAVVLAFNTEEKARQFLRVYPADARVEPLDVIDRAVVKNESCTTHAR